MKLNPFYIAMHKPWLRKISRIMKLTTMIILIALLQCSARGYSQKVNLNETNTPLTKVLKEIKKQTGYVFFYDNKDVNNKNVNVHLTDASLDDALTECLKNQSLTYKIVNKAIVLQQTDVVTANKASNLVAAVITITGQVVDDKDLPLPGVTVKVKDGKAAVITDANGKFSIDVPDNKAVLVFSFVGFVKKELPATTNSPMLVKLEVDRTGLSEVVVLGYATQKKELVTGSVESIKFKEADTEIPTTMAGNLLAGKAAGLTVSTPNGLPGQSAPGITIRTPNSFNAQPVLYVIDGKIMGSGDFNNLSPNDIDNISILKDASAAAVYGSRAAGGVIVVTTKRGKKGTASIQYSFNTGEDYRTKNMALTNGVQMMNLYNQISNGGGGALGNAFSAADIANMQSINNGYGYNQLQTVYRNPSTTTHNLSVSGGTEKIQYFIGGSYVKDKGFLNNLEYDKYNFRSNITAQVAKDLTFFGGVTLNNNITSSTTSTPIGDPYGIYAKLLVWQPWQPVWTDSGKAADYGWIGNVGAETHGDGGYIRSNYLKPVINMNLTYKVPFIPGLSATASYSKSYADNRTKYFQKQYAMYATKTSTDGYIISTKDADIIGTRMSSQVNPSYIAEQATWSEDKQINFQLNYDHTFGTKNHLKGWLIYEAYNNSGSGVSAQINGFPAFTTDQWWAASPQAINQFVSNSTNYSDYANGRRSWVGQFLYDYDEKYLATFSYRYDGSMNFAPNKRWGLFPSGSLGWIVSKEPFFKKDGWIDLLKVTVSAGLIGNDNIGGWQWQDSYVNGSNAYLGTSPAINSGITYGGVANPNLTWEKSLNENFAVEMDFLNHFNARAEYWRTHTYDILGPRIVTVPPTFSRTLPPVNYGVENAQGIELTLGYAANFGKVRFNTSINASYGNAWIVTKDEAPTYPWQRTVGRSTSYVAAYQVVGMIRTQADLDNLVKNDPNYNFNGDPPMLGQLIYKDNNHDGVIDDKDQAVIRNNNNPINLGWNVSASWNGFSVDATFSGRLNQWVSVGNLTGGVEWNRLWQPWATDSWSPTNPNASLPLRQSANDGTSDAFQSNSNFWWKNASFIRLRSLTIGYSIPKVLCKKIGIEGIKFYASGTNLFTISGFNSKYYDPELRYGTDFPIMRSMNLGANVSF